MWKGRFSESTADVVQSFTESISFDKRLYYFDIKGSIAHAEALKKANILTNDEFEAIEKSLNKILNDIKEGNFDFKIELEDIHMNIESALIEDLGDVGAKLHTARSRNDQVSLDMRMYCKDEIKNIISLISDFQKSLLFLSENNSDVIIPGYTHLQRAQPVIFSHHILAYVEMFERDKSRLTDCLDRLDVMPLGSGALAGSTINLDRNLIADKLGFKKVSTNSMDAISDRDFIAELVFIIGLCQVHMSRLSEDLILWSSSEFGFIEISDAFTTGSSLMPQKKNPDIAELVRGKTGRTLGNIINILTVIKGLPLTYNRDFQEDKIPLFDSIDTISDTLKVVEPMMRNIKVISEKCIKASMDEFLLATDIVDYLVIKGESFRNAHKIIGELTAFCLSKNKNFSSLDIETWQGFSPKFEEDIKKYLNPKHSISLRTNVGSPSLSQIEKQIEHWKSIL